MCASGDCVENTAPASEPEGGLTAWRTEAPMPVDLYYHAAAASDSRLFVSGGLMVRERSANGSATLDRNDTIYAATLEQDGQIAEWREVGKLDAPLTNHATAVAGDRLYVIGGDGNEAPRRFVDSVISFEISAEGALRDRREEASLPSGRAWHVALADTKGGRARLIVAAGSTDSKNFTNGSSAILIGDLASDGSIARWGAVEAPAPLYFSHGAGVAAGSFFGFVAGDYNDRSSRSLHGIRLKELTATAEASAFVASVAWPFDPGALSATDEDVHLTGACEALVMVGKGGVVGTAPVDGGAEVGQFRPASRFFGASTGSATAVTPAGRVYVTGGFGSSEEGVAVHSAAHW